jgi:hypothetical protein
MKLLSAGALALAVALSAHVGTNDVSFVGHAGPYAVRVTIRQPGVVPGLADITIRTPETGIDRVMVTALRRIGETGEAPPADEAARVPGEAGMYSAQLWLMVRGPHSVIVTVDGVQGEGRVGIPIVARATAQLEMSRALGFVLAGGGLFLAVGLLSIVGAAIRESGLAPGAMPAPREIRRARIATGIAGITLGTLLFGGWNWIRSEADWHRARLDRPWRVATSLETTGEQNRLRLALTDSRWTNRPRNRPNDIMPDHGKMMHLFIIDAEDAGAFAHVHPVRLAEDSFAVAFPPLPSGNYRIFADIVQEDGGAQTLVANVQAPGPVTSATTTPAVDPDDAWWTGAAASGDTTTLAEGVRIQWQNRGQPLIEGQDAEFEFVVESTDGAPVRLEPYMGMAGHAMVARMDGEVFVHLHPVGMISMAAQAALDPDAVPLSSESGHPNAHAEGQRTAELRFPLVVPAAGRYRIWVQVRHAGEIRTVAFDATISEGRAEAGR